MAKTIQDFQAPFKMAGLMLAALNTGLSIVLIVAGIGLATRKRWGWSLGRWACVLGIGFEVVRIVVGLAQQGYMLFKASTLSSANLGSDVPEQAGQFMAVTMSVMMIFGMFTLVAYAIGKILVYYFSRRHLSKPEVAQLFS